MNRRSNVRAFTLIELLVVIAIIAILAAILFPVFAQARSKARQAAGLSNAKQVTLAVLQYVQDYDEKFPRAGWDCAGPATGRDDDMSFPANGHNGCGATAWQNVISAYHKNSGIFTSPGDASTNLGISSAQDGNFSLLFNDLIVHNMKLDANGFSDPNGGQIHFADGGSLAGINSSADCILLAEGHCGWDDKVSNSGTAEDKVTLWNGIKYGIDSNGKVASKWYREQTISGFQSFLLAGKSYGDWTTNRVTGAPFYNGGGNVAFTDGHAKYYKMADSSGNPILRTTLPWIKNIDPKQNGLANSKTGDEAANGKAAGWQ